MKKEIQIPKSHRNEWQSKRDFQNLIEQLGLYMPFEWSVRDYGIDGQIEITSPIKNSDSFRPESKFFLIQLKSSEKIKFQKDFFSFSIPTIKISQWFGANLPVMLVVNDIKTKAFYFRWISEELINTLENSDPNWVSKKTISIKFSNENNFTNYTLREIKEYVINWRQPLRKIIRPGIYFEVKDKCLEFVKQYSDITQPFAFDSTNKDIERLNKQLESSIYRIAITGPSRVGKSTLINALLRRNNISPTGFFQTTGVPIQFVPGKDEYVKVSFKDGTSITEKLSTAIIENYASQNKNEDNKKGVSILTISLQNQQLEKGVSICDLPGLDDPDDMIFDFTWSTVTKANAILYLIDASPHEHGGFIFRSEYKKHILELGQSLDKIFLVFNKVNVLTGNKLELLKERVISDLKRLELFDKVSEKIHYISAEDSLKIRLKKIKGNDFLDQLESDVWTYILKENKAGLVNLSLANKEILGSIDNFQSILEAKNLDLSKRKILEDTIEKIKKRLPDIGKLYQQKEHSIRTGIKKSLEYKKLTLLSDYEQYLESIPLDGELPTKEEIRDHFIKAGHDILNETNKEYQNQVALLKEIIDIWIEDNLKQVRDIISNNPSKKVEFDTYNNLQIPTIDLTTAFGTAILSGLMGLILFPEIAIVTTLLGFLSNLLFSAADRRSKRIKKLMKHITERLHKQFASINLAYDQLLTEQSKIILEYADSRLSTYLGDITNQISNLNIDNFQMDEQIYAEISSKLNLLRVKVIETQSEIHSLYSSI